MDDLPIQSEPPLSLADGEHCVLEARQLSRKMGHVEVLRGIDLKIGRGEAVVLRGGNGAGKTTLLRCLAGALRPSKGEVLWFGERAGRAPASRALIGFSGHESGLYDELTPLENLVFTARMFGHSQPLDVALQFLEFCGLNTWKHHPVRRLSRGIRQRVSIGRAIIHEPAIILLDEPFSGLDHEGRMWIANQLQELAEQGRAICFSSHGEELAAGMKCRVLWLQSGHLIESREPAILRMSA